MQSYVCLWKFHEKLNFKKKTKKNHKIILYKYEKVHQKLYLKHQNNKKLNP